MFSCPKENEEVEIIRRNLNRTSQVEMMAQSVTTFRALIEIPPQVEKRLVDKAAKNDEARKPPSQYVLHINPVTEPINPQSSIT